MQTQFALVQQNQLHLSTLKLSLYCLGMFPEPQPLPVHSSRRKAMYGFGQVLFLPESSIINANILFYSELPAKLSFSGSSGGECTEGKRGGGVAGWGTHMSQRENWDMLESVSKKAPALRDVPNAASPFTAQLHIHLLSILSIYPINGLSCSSLFYLQSTLPDHPSYFYITSFSLYSHLDFQSFLKGRGCIIIYFFHLSSVSSFKSQNISFEQTTCTAKQVIFGVL